MRYVFLLLLAAATTAQAKPIQSNICEPGKCCQSNIKDDTPTYRNPVGHTHTCPSCGNTWDHQANPGHTCSQCGTSQYVQDYSPKMVPLKPRVVTLVSPNGVRLVSPAATPFALQEVDDSSNSAVSGGCASGNCGTSTQRFELFPNRPRLLFR